MTGRIGGGKPKADVEAWEEMLRHQQKWVWNELWGAIWREWMGIERACQLGRSRGGGHRYQVDPPDLLNLSYCVYQVLLSNFTRLTFCCVSGVNEDMWMQEENLQGKVIAKQVSFLRKSSRGLFQFPLPPVFHLSSCHTLQELWQRDLIQLWSFYEAVCLDLWQPPPPFPSSYLMFQLLCLLLGNTSRATYIWPLTQVFFQGPSKLDISLNKISSAYV